MELKPWFSSGMGVKLPPELSLPTVRAVAPYDTQIEALDRQVGGVFARETLKDASGVSQMDAKTQVTRLNGVSVLDAAQYSLEGKVCLALLKEQGGENERKLVSVAIGAFLNLHGDVALVAAQASRVLDLAVDDQEDDADRAKQADALAEPLEEEEVADDRQREVRLHQLAERVDQREEQHPEADHREPVRHRDDRQPRHPGVPEELTQQRHRPGALVAGARAVRLAEAEDGEELPDDPCEQGDPHQGDHSTDDERDDLERRHGRHSTGR
jgi:hypothetical protein